MPIISEYIRASHTITEYSGGFINSAKIIWDFHAGIYARKKPGFADRACDVLLLR
jgi:hypothetical protein